MRVALVGAPGIGKTAIVHFFVDRMEEGADERAVFWVDASSVESVKQSFLALASTFGYDDWWYMTAAENPEFTRTYLRWILSGPWLVVLDNLQHSTAFFLAEAHLLPQGLQCDLLVTASNPACLAFLGRLTKTIHVPGLQDESAIDLFRRGIQYHTGRTVVDQAEEQIIEMLAPRLQGRPGAILAAAGGNLDRLRSFLELISRLWHQNIGRNGLGQACRFVPERPLQQYWSEMPDRLQILDLIRSTDFSAWIQACAWRTCSILMLMNRMEMVHLFYALGVNDEDLPLLSSPSSWPQGDEERAFFHDFYALQWMFLPLQLDRLSIQNRELPQLQILPISSQQTIEKSPSCVTSMVYFDHSCILTPVRSSAETLYFIH